MRTHFGRIFLLFAIWIAIEGLGKTFLLLWFLTNGIAPIDLVTYFGAMFLAPLVCAGALFNRQFRTKNLMRLGIGLNVLSYLPVIFWPTPGLIYLSGFLIGLSFILFWGAYNTVHFKNSSSERRGFYSSLYFMIGPVVGLVMPLIAGLIAQIWGLKNLLMLATVAYIVPFLLVRLTPDTLMNFKVYDALRANKIKALIFLEGVIGAIRMVIIPITVLAFAKQPFELGAFFALLSAAGAVANIFLARRSDKTKKRRSYFYNATLGVVVSAFALAGVQNLFALQILGGFHSFFVVIAGAFWVTLTLEYIQAEESVVMVIREIYLNLGRLFATILAGVVWFFMGSFDFALILIGGLALAYPILAHFKKVYRL